MKRYMSSVTRKLIGAIDQGTSSSRFIVYDEVGRCVASAQKEFDLIHVKPGWVEQDPRVLLSTVTDCISEVMQSLSEPLAAVGITNQRETTVLWDKNTGEPLHNALVWLDTRTSDTIEKLLEEKQCDKEVLRSRCGLPLATYFSALKIKWLMDNDAGVKKACDEQRCIFGTVDSWLIWNLTGGAHVTDVSNASRTMLMKSSSEVYGHFCSGELKGTPIAGCLGDQQAALVGQQCFEAGEAKNTYGTGCFLLMNTGTQKVDSKHGLLSTVAYQLGVDSETHYALEGSIAVAGASIKWLNQNLGLCSNALELNKLAASVEDTGGVYFVPAFSGLFAPYWRDDARGVIVGLSQYTTKAHLCRAALEAVCFQTKEVLDAMYEDSGVALNLLKVDGGMTRSDLMLQIQSDLLGIEVVRGNQESTALGAAFAAGIAVNIFSAKCLPDTSAAGGSFTPKLSDQERALRLEHWKRAVERSFDWAQ